MIQELTFALAALLAICVASAQGTDREEPQNPFAGDAGASQQGKALFRANCGLCHGMDARGGRGPDLTAGRWLHGDTDAAVFRTISKGVAGTEMPPADLREEEVWMVVAFLRSLAVHPAAPLPGSREAGEKIFFGRGLCSQCHMVNGRGGRFGPNLSRIGASRSPRYLVESIRDPSKEIPPGYEPVVAITREGTRIAGVRKNEDTFSLQIMDQQERFHLLLKRDLKEVSYEKESLMPQYDERMLSEKELQDVVAYLDSLRGQP